jgi:hypothetical protein
MPGPLPECACPTCGTKVNDATVVFHGASKASPAPGDVTVCIYCAAVSIFDDELCLRRPTPDEQREIARDPRVQKTVAEIRRHVHQRN